MSSKQNKRCPRKAGISCNKIMPYCDNHDICRACRNFSCSRSSVCNTCAVWTDDMWKKFDKCIMRSDMAKSSRAKTKEVSAPLLSLARFLKNGPDRETLLLPIISNSVSATDTRNAVLSEQEPDRDSVPRGYTQTLVRRSVPTMEHIFPRDCSSPRSQSGPRNIRVSCPRRKRNLSSSSLGESSSSDSLVKSMINLNLSVGDLDLYVDLGHHATGIGLTGIIGVLGLSHLFLDTKDLRQGLDHLL